MRIRANPVALAAATLECSRQNRYACMKPVALGATDVSTAFWAWICVTVFLVLGEALTGGLLVLPWAVGAGVAALLEALHVNSDWQWAAFAGISVTLFGAVQRLIRGRK
jgi:hypothetical protein